MRTALLLLCLASAAYAQDLSGLLKKVQSTPTRKVERGLSEMKMKYVSVEWPDKQYGWTFLYQNSQGTYTNMALNPPAGHMRTQELEWYTILSRDVVVKELPLIYPMQRDTLSAQQSRRLYNKVVDALK
ncbi:MAG: hypothetical protein V1725_07835 [archaeon]